MDNRSSLALKIGRIAALFLIIYFFLLSIGLLSGSFKLFGKEFAEGLVELASNPMVGLLAGILATTLVQSSSTTTSMIVGLVGAGTLNLEIAIPMVMGANIGTTVTNTIVSVGHITRGEEFKRAFAASTVHDVFNVLAVIVFLPLQIATGFLSKASAYLADVFQSAGGLEFASPLKTITKPVVKSFLGWLDGTGLVSPDALPWVGSAIAIAVMLLALRQLVKLRRLVILGRVEQFFQRYLFGNPLYALILGTFLTVLVQSSSITTSIIIPLVGAGILSVAQVFPYTLGANIGTTTTALLASLVTGNPVAVAVAFSHLIFNLCGMALFWPLARIPLAIADRLSRVAVKSKFAPFLYILIVFYALPGALIFLMR
ncbi:MAG: Na/Pi symporter [Candidatus Zixiibacteriota bacterium]